MSLVKRYKDVRTRTEAICSSLKVEDYVVQPIVDVSPPKWHLGHTTWFWETFVLKQYLNNYVEYDGNYNYVFNSYYEAVGARVVRTDRGNLSRPSVEDVYNYRRHVDDQMIFVLEQPANPELTDLILLGLNHEEQHQELLITDIKYILGHNPLLPSFECSVFENKKRVDQGSLLTVDEGVYDIGFAGEGFCFDNELSPHKVYLAPYQINTALVTNADFLQFIYAGGYSDFRHWHAEGWEWIKANGIQSPLYWHLLDGEWMNYTFNGLQPIDMIDPVCHVSYYEAAAYASWRSARLPTEFEWEVASGKLNWGRRWEWTESAYLPYPGFSKAPGPIGEYNGKFMVNQMVLRGSSEATSPGHSRATYRNFFHPPLRWQYTGIRLANNLK